MDTLRYDLKYPIIHSGKEYKEILIRRPKVKDFQKFKMLNEDYYLASFLVQAEFFIKQCGSLPEDVLNEMDHAGDYTALLDRMTNFLANDQWSNGAT